MIPRESSRGGSIEPIFTEICYVLGSKKQMYALSHEEIKEKLLPLIMLKNIKMENKDRVVRAKENIENKELEK